jgi:hypothetical protein
LPQFSGETQFAKKFPAFRLCWRFHQLSGRAQDADCDRQVESPAFFQQVSGCQVHHDPAVGKVVATVRQRTFDPVSGLSNRSLGQTHQGKARQATGEVSFDDDLWCRHAELSSAQGSRSVGDLRNFGWASGFRGCGCAFPVG